MEKQPKYISREEWLIRLMQGMVGDYGSNKNATPAQCYYYNGTFMAKYKDEEHSGVLRLEYITTDKFWITDTKGVPMEQLNIINIEG